MKRILFSLLIVFFYLVSAQSQEVIKLYQGVPPGNDNVAIEEKITKKDGVVDVISEVTIPTLTAYLPAASKATGTAVVILPGGALRFLSWDMEGVRLAQWLNEKGIAAFILKYRLVNSNMKRSAPNTGTPPLRVAVYEADKLANANANPLKDSVSMRVIKMASEDTRQAIRLIRENAAKWKINPAKLGCIGFSAGGGVELSAAMHNTDQNTMPAFIATIYGPALEDVVVPNPAPPLFIATCADHMNVAAGCLALFESWKKAGGEAEIHLYGKGKGGFGMIKQNQPSDEWVNSFYTWLVSGGF